MNRKQHRPEGRNGSVADGQGDVPKGEATPMENFAILTRKILAVSNDQLKEKQRRYEIANAGRRKRKPREGI